ncbi:MAG: TPR repeat protein [Methylophilaceae bacterium]|jgi:TPR repeat protein
MYENGMGVIQNFILAHMWFNLAATNNALGAVVMRDEILFKKMTLSQIAEAQKLARECQARNYKNCD